MAVGDVFKKRRNLVQSAAPSVNIWNSGRMRRSPAPMTYADPNSDPNIGMYDLARGIDALREQSQIRFPSNPMSPTFGVVNPDVESARRLAPMLAQDAARQQNTPMNGMTAYEANPMRYNPTDPAIQARQQDNAQRMSGGFLMDRTRGDGGARFAGSAGRINAEYDKVQAGQGIFNNGQFLDFTPTGTPESARAAQLAGKTERELLRNRNNMNVPQTELDRRDAADMARREAQARHNQFKDANNGMNYRQYDRMQNQNALTMKAVDEGRLSPEAANLRMQTRADKALRRAGNPMMMGTDESRRLFPNVLGNNGAANQAGPNPMIGGGRTLEDQQAAAARIQERETTNPIVAGLGAEPGSGLAGLNAAFRNRIAEDPNAQFSDESLREYQAHAKDYGKISTDQNSSFAFGSSEVDTRQSALWKELAGLPDNPRVREEWLRKYKSQTAEGTEADKQRLAEKPQAPVYGDSPPAYGNPYGYAAPYSNTFNRGIKPPEMYKNPMK